MKKIIITFSALLIGCTSNSVIDESTNNKKCDEDFSYCINLPADMEKSSWGETVGRSGAKVDHIASNEYSFNDPQSSILEVYNTISCPLLGVSKPENLNGASWGKVDFWSNREHVMDIQNEYPFCRPAGGQTGVGYAFCAEKDGKAVAICIQQMTDNPELAKEIFESFKWLPSGHSEPVE